MDDDNQAAFGGLSALREALDRALTAVKQPEVCPRGFGQAEFLAVLSAADTGTGLEEASSAAMRQAIEALSVGNVHAMNALMAAANAGVARVYADWVDPRFFGVAPGEPVDINIARAWIALQAAETAAKAAIAIAR